MSEHVCGRWCAQHTAMGGPLDAAEPAPPTDGLREVGVAQAADGTGLSDRALAATCNAAVSIASGHTLGCACEGCDQLRAFRLVDGIQRLIAADEAVRRVEAIIARLHPDNHMWRDELRRALDGDRA